MPSKVDDLLEHVMRIRRWMGVHPLNKDSSVSILNLIFTIIAVCLPCFLRFLFISMGYHRQGIIINSHLYSALSTVQSFIMLCCSLVSVFGYIRNLKRFQKIKLRLIVCDLFLRKIQHPIDYDTSYIKQYIWGFCIFSVTVAGFDTLTRNYHFFWFVYVLMYYYHKTIVWIGELLFVAILKMIALQMFVLQKNLRTNNLIITEKSVIEFNRLIRLCYEVNDIFSLSNLLNFSNYFISLTLNTYYVSLLIARGYYIRTVTLFSWISFRILGSFLIVQSTEEISRQCEHFKEQLGAMMMIRDNEYLENETLLNYLRMEKVFKFNAMRFFNIDKRFYLTMLSTAVSYLVLIFQLTSNNYCENESER